MPKNLDEETNAVMSWAEEEVTPVRPTVNLIDVLFEQGGLIHFPRPSSLIYLLVN